MCLLAQFIEITHDPQDTRQEKKKKKKKEEQGTYPDLDGAVLRPAHQADGCVGCGLTLQDLEAGHSRRVARELLHALARIEVPQLERVVCVSRCAVVRPQHKVSCVLRAGRTLRAGHDEVVVEKLEAGDPPAVAVDAPHQHARDEVLLLDRVCVVALNWRDDQARTRFVNRQHREVLQTNSQNPVNPQFLHKRKNLITDRIQNRGEKPMDVPAREGSARRSARRS